MKGQLVRTHVAVLYILVVLVVGISAANNLFLKKKQNFSKIFAKNKLADATPSPAFLSKTETGTETTNTLATQSSLTYFQEGE